jgi:hypothetical protein
VVVPASDPKDLFVERVTMLWVGLVKYHVIFPVLRMFGAEGKDGGILTLGDGWCNTNLGTRGGFCGM